MKFDQFEQLVKHISKDITCPKCKKIFDYKSIEILSLKNNDAIFQINCGNCKSKISIDAKFEQILQSKDPTPNTIKNHNIPQNISLSPNTIKDISQSVKNFKGKDVKELFLDKK